MIPCSVLYHEGMFMLYYSAHWGTPTHGAIGLAISSDGVNFVRITDGLDGTSKVLREEESEAWEHIGVAGASVFYDNGKYYMYYSGMRFIWRKEGKEMNIGYAESEDGKNWIRAVDNPVVRIGSADWENDYLVSCSFVWNGDSKNRGLVYYQGAYAESPPTNRIGVFAHSRKHVW